MKADELEDLQIYSQILSNNINTINVLSSIVYARIQETDRCLRNFKRFVDDKLLQNTRQNH